MSDTGGSGGGPQIDEDGLVFLTGQPRVIRSFQERQRRVAELPTVARSERVPERQFHTPKRKGTIVELPTTGGGGGGEPRPIRGVVRRYRITDLPLRNVMQLTEAQQRNWARRRIEMYPYRSTGYHQGGFELEAGYRSIRERILMRDRYNSLGRILREERQIIKEKPFKHLLDSVFINSRDYRNKRIREGRR